MLVMRTIRNIAIDAFAAIAGATVYIIVMLIMLLACAYCRLRGKEI